MPINLPTGFMNVTFHHALPTAAGDAVMTLGIDRTASSLTPQEDLEAIKANYDLTVMQRMLSSTTCTGLTAIVMTAGGAQSHEVNSANGGAISGEGMPASVAILVQKLTGFAGKKNRGRMFVPGVPKSSSSGSLPNSFASGQLAAWQTVWDNFRAGLIADDLLPVILHQQGVADPPRAVTSFEVQDRFATQRGRLRD